MAEPTKISQLENELIELYEVIDERDARIDDLENRLAEKESHDAYGRRRSEAERYDDEQYRHTSELQSQLLASKDEIVDLRAELHQSRTDNESLLEDHKQLQHQILSQKSLLDVNKKRLAAATMITEETQKRRKDNSSHHYTLELENKKLRDSIVELEKIEESLVAEVEVISLEYSDAVRRIQQSDAQYSLVEMELEDSEQRCVQLEKDTAELRTELESEAENLSSLRRKFEVQSEEFREMMNDINNELGQEKEKTAKLRKDLIVLKDKSLPGVLQQKNESLLEELESYKYDLQNCLEEKEKLDQELRHLTGAFNTFKIEHEEIVVEAVTTERKKLKELVSKLSEQTLRVADLQKNESHLERLKDESDDKLRCAEERNQNYEERSGIREAAITQRKLEADVRRRDFDLSELQLQVNSAMNRCKMLETACAILKKKAGLGEEYVFEEKELIGFMAGQESKEVELLKQISMLERDRCSLMMQLRENARSIGEDGIRFLGLNATQLMNVTEFANNIKNGEVTLPLDDRSIELKKQVRTLSMENEVDKQNIRRLERELDLCRPPISNFEGSEAHRDLHRIQQLLEEVQLDNKQLRIQLVEMSSRRPASEHNEVMIESPYRRKIEDMLGEPIAAMPREAQEQLLRLIVVYEKKEIELEETSERRNDKKSEASNQSPLMESATITDLINESKKALFCSSKFPQETDFSGYFQAAHIAEYPCITSQLVKCLEQISQHDAELTAQDHTCKDLESTINAEIALLYDKFVDQLKRHEEGTFQLEKKISELTSEREDLRIQLHQYNNLDTQSTNSESHVLQQTLRKTTQRAILHEINEQRLARKYSSMREQLDMEAAARVRADQNLLEMESHLKERIIYLEHWKAWTTGRLERLYNIVEESVPRLVHEQMQEELASLRTLYLEGNAEKTEIQLKMAECQDEVFEFIQLKNSLEIRLKTAQDELNNAMILLDEHKLLSKQCARGNISDSKLESLLKEASECRIENAKTNMALKSALARVEEISKQNVELSGKYEALLGEMQLSQRQEIEHVKMIEKLQVKIAQSKNDRVAKVSVLQEQIHKQKETNELSVMEIKKFKDLSNLASEQAKKIRDLQTDYKNEMKDLQEMCTEIESKSGDNVIIGKLERQLLNLKNANLDLHRKENIYQAEKKEVTNELYSLKRQIDNLRLCSQKERERGRAKLINLQSVIRKLVENGGNAEFAWKLSSGHISVADAAEDSAAGSSEDHEFSNLVLNSKALAGKVSALVSGLNEQRTKLISEAEQNRNLLSQVDTLKEENNCIDYTLQQLRAAWNGDKQMANTKTALVAMGGEVRSAKLLAAQLQSRERILVDENNKAKYDLGQYERKIAEYQTEIASMTTKYLMSGLENDMNHVVGSIENGAQIEAAGIQTQQLPHANGNGQNLCDCSEEESNEETNQQPQQNVSPPVFTSTTPLAEPLVISGQAAGAAIRDVIHSFDERKRENIQRSLHSPRKGKIAEVAALSVQNMKVLLEEKNQTIEKYRRKLGEQREVYLREREALYNDKNEDIAEVNRENVGIMRRWQEAAAKNDTSGACSESRLKELIDQLEEAQQILNSKEDQLVNCKSELDESKLLCQNVELQLRQSTEEIDRMKVDMSTIASQLHEAETRASALENEYDERKTLELRSHLRQKDTKITCLRKAIVKLKEYIIKLEEEKATCEKPQVLKSSVNKRPVEAGNTTEESERLNIELKNVHITKEKCVRALKASRKKLEEGTHKVGRLEKEVVTLKKAVAEGKSELSILRAKSKLATEKIARTPKEANHTNIASSRGKCDRDCCKKRILELSRQNRLLRGAIASKNINEEKENKLQQRKALTARNTGSLADENFNDGKRLRRNILSLKNQLKEKCSECESVHDKLEETRKQLHNERFRNRKPIAKEVTRTNEREEELEALVETLKRLIEKLKADNARLSRGFVDNSKIALIEKKTKAAVEKVKSLEKENALLKENLQEAEENAEKSEEERIHLQQVVNGTHLQDINSRKDGLSFADQEEHKHAKQQVHQLAVELDQLTESMGILSKENDRLTNLNTNLETELKAFDLNFFEEIEDLKSKYNDAVQQLEYYEKQAGNY